MKEINIILPKLPELCPTCLGSGKLKAMQAAMTYDAGTVRAADTTIKCNMCKGSGWR